jgi:two-component system OmpR family sensor kinase
VLLLGDMPEGQGDFLERICSLLAAVLPRLGLDGVRALERASSEVGIAWTAHELKGPLMGASAALERAADSREDQGRELLRRTREELQRLSELIDPLLRWSTGAAAPVRGTADLVTITREAVASSCFGLNGDRARVSIDAADHPLVRADRRQLQSAIANVVRNALLYSPSGSPVGVRVESPNGSARVIVRDQGPGIPPGERSTIFDPFSRGRANGSQPGSGLGLFIARRVLEAHGGSIAMRSANRGATFVLELPVDKGSWVSKGRRSPSAS